MNQNELLNNQNTLIQRQMSLEEANRRSALVVLMSNIMDKVDREIEKQQDLLPKGITKGARDSARFQLSQSLIGQIAALSHSFKPYRYMSGDTLISKPLSPERAQLLITLTLLPLDTVTLDKIYKSATFYSADLEFATLNNQYLSGANLIRANLTGADLRKVNLSRANLTDANLRGTFLHRANLRDANLSEANLSETYSRWADLSGANLIDANLSGANLGNADLSRTYYLKFEMLKLCRSLHECKGLPDDIIVKLKQEKPDIFEGVGI
jgi:hypothetical protein